MINLDVYLTSADGHTRLAGHYACEEWTRPGAPRQGAFIYAAPYLDNPRFLELDPAGLPRSDQEFPFLQEPWMPGALEDALPDAWGRALIRRAHPQITYRDLPAMLALCRQGAGALGVTAQGSDYEAPVTERTLNLEHLLDAADRMQHASATDPDIQLLLRAGSSLGGARPKALVQDDEAEWIAKFPAKDDVVEIPRVEAACLALAAKAGLKACLARLIEVSSRPVLLVRRFDISPQNGRYHMISMRTLLGNLSDHAASYGLYADQLRRWAAAPRENLERLYRQMVFNACIGNTDDHAKNFSLQFAEDGWQLTPAYDLLPDVNNNREHTSMIGQSNTAPSRSGLLATAQEFNIKPSTAARIVDEVVDALSDWRMTFKQYDVAESDIMLLEPDIKQRIDRLRK